MGTNRQWFEKNHFNGCKRGKTVSIIARLKHFVLISWIQSSDNLLDLSFVFHQIFLLQKDFSVYYCIFTRDDSELKYSRLNKGNKSSSRKWPENWNSIYSQTFENVHKIALWLHNCYLHFLIESNESIEICGENEDLWRKCCIYWSSVT